MSSFTQTLKTNDMLCLTDTNYLKDELASQLARVFLDDEFSLLLEATKKECALKALSGDYEDIKDDIAYNLAYRVDELFKACSINAVDDIKLVDVALSEATYLLAKTKLNDKECA